MARKFNRVRGSGLTDTCIACLRDRMRILSMTRCSRSHLVLQAAIFGFSGCIADHPSLGLIGDLRLLRRGYLPAVPPSPLRPTLCRRSGGFSGRQAALIRRRRKPPINNKAAATIAVVAGSGVSLAAPSI